MTKLILIFARLPRYFTDLRRLRHMSMDGDFPIQKLLPCIHDFTDNAVQTNGQYFQQDLYVAQRIYELNPERHVDIASRLDGFVADVASFREIKVIDIRPTRTGAAGSTFKQLDCMSPNNIHNAYADSVSCLHALKHFGLGRYADPLDPNGQQKGFQNLGRILKPGGRLHLSLPIGPQRIEFNGHRSFFRCVFFWICSRNT